MPAMTAVPVLAAGKSKFALLFLVAACACNTRGREKNHAAEAAPSAAAVPRSGAKPHFLKRPRDGAPLEQFVQQEVEKADSQGLRVVVYEGATWCEPCQ